MVGPGVRFRRLRAALLAIMAASALAACETVPVTGRQQLIMLSVDEEQAMGLQSFREVLAEERVSRDPRHNARVRRVGERVAVATGRSDLDWEFRVIEKDEVNAFCLPGGKVAVYTGLLELAESDDELAAVMGHEVAHAIARHGAERVSQNMVAEIGVAVAAVAIGASVGGDSDLWAALLGAGATVGVLLPYSRLHESEADGMGLTYMARAGYDPRAAVTFWKRMAARKGGGSLEFLSTHPADETRIRELEALMPAALQTYQAARPAPGRATVPASAPASAPVHAPAAAASTSFSKAPAAAGRTLRKRVQEDEEE